MFFSKYIKKLNALFLTIATATSFLAGCASFNDSVTVSDFKLNTFVSITAYGIKNQSILEECLRLCDYYENMFSRTKESSTLYKVNHQEITEIPAELAELIQYGLDYSKLSNGAFDVAIGSVSSLWDFTASNPAVPVDSLIKDALQYVDYRNVVLTQINEDTYRIDLPEGKILDLGAIAKGYIADRIRDYLLDHGVKRATINLGGNVLCVGNKPGNTNFNIGIKKPFTENEYAAIVGISDMSVVSSGTYERYFVQDGISYHHILNPKTGYPYDNDLTGVTILSKESVIGDCLSTTCFALGLDKGLELIESLDNIEAMFITSDGNVHYSSGSEAYIKK